MLHHTARPGRGLTSLLTVAGLSLATAAVTVPARSAEPAGDCTETYPLELLTAGDTVGGLTVERGTTPEAFTGEVLGVLEDGIAPGLDMVLAELDSPALDAAGGIWQGMSGSPVYADDGRLIGAVAYGLSYGPSPVAGITPFGDMDDYLDAEPASRVGVPAGLARRIAAESDVAAAEAAHGLRPLAMPLGVSGLGPQRLERVQKSGRAYLPRNTYAAPGVGASAAPEDIVAGGNLAASLSHGDITQAGVGTATYVCGDEVVGFGHPLRFTGDAAMAMHPADAIYVQPDPLGAPFKVANLAAPAGTITDDRLAGITGVFGVPPTTTEVSSAITFGNRSRTGTSQVSESDSAAATTFYQQVANYDRVVDAVGAGSEVQTWTVTGTGPNGAPFTLSFADRYASSWDLSFEAAYPLADMVALLGEVRGVTIESVRSEATVAKDASTYRLQRMEQWRDGAWRKVDSRTPALVKAGRVLRIRTVLASGGTTRALRSSYVVPRKAAGTRARLSVIGGDSYWSDDFFYEEFEDVILMEEFGAASEPTLADIREMVSEMLRNDQVWSGLRLGRGPATVTKEKVLGQVDRVVSGYREVKVVIS